MVEDANPGKFRVVVVGGGVAALEAILALRRLAEEVVSVTVVTSAVDYAERPMSVTEPFSFGGAHRRALAPILEDLGAEQITDDLASVDATAQTVLTEGGQVVPYDALLIATGARPAVRYEHAVTIDDRKIDELLHGMIQDIEGDYIHSVAFVAPDQMVWPLPLYELALMTAHRAWLMGIALETTIVTPEARPLGVFGTAVSDGVSALLDERGIKLFTGAHADVPRRRQITIFPGQRELAVERVVALPQLFGPSIPGLPADESGFLPIDSFTRVANAGPVFAAGDAADGQVKQGGLASQMADVAARSITELAGGHASPHEFAPILRGKLLTGTAPLYLYARLVDGEPQDSAISDTPMWHPDSKISSVLLARYLEERDEAKVGSVEG